MGGGPSLHLGELFNTLGSDTFRSDSAKFYAMLGDESGTNKYLLTKVYSWVFKKVDNFLHIIVFSKLKWCSPHLNIRNISISCVFIYF